jgi:hypothetical protein
MAAMPLHVSACWRQCRNECMLAALPHAGGNAAAVSARCMAAVPLHTYWRQCRMAAVPLQLAAVPLLAAMPRRQCRKKNKKI